MNHDIKSRNGGWDSAECPICGKEFFPTPGWAYKLNSARGRLRYKPVCSYGCLCRAKKEIEGGREAAARARARKTEFPEELKYRRRRVRCVNTGAVYASARQASKATGVSESCVGEICRGKVAKHFKTGLAFEYVTEEKENHPG